MTLHYSTTWTLGPPIWMTALTKRPSARSTEKSYFRGPSAEAGVSSVSNRLRFNSIRVGFLERARDPRLARHGGTLGAVLPPLELSPNGQSLSCCARGFSCNGLVKPLRTIVTRILIPRRPSNNLQACAKIPLIEGLTPWHHSKSSMAGRGTQPS